MNLAMAFFHHLQFNFVVFCLLQDEHPSVQLLWSKMFRSSVHGPWEFDRLKWALVNVAISLTMSTIGILERWAGEPRIVKRAEMLLFVIARHILPFMGRLVNLLYIMTLFKLVSSCYLGHLNKKSY